MTDHLSTATPTPVTDVQACPRCGDQTLWRVARNRQGELKAWCNLCGHEWAIVERNVFRCTDPEGQWIADQEREATP